MVHGVNRKGGRESRDADREGEGAENGDQEWAAPF